MIAVITIISTAVSSVITPTPPIMIAFTVTGHAPLDLHLCETYVEVKHPQHPIRPAHPKQHAHSVEGAVTHTIPGGDVPTTARTLVMQYGQSIAMD